MNVHQTAFAYAAFAAGGLVAGLTLGRLLQSLRSNATIAKPHCTKSEVQVLMDAVQFSSEKHKDQRRKNTLQHPYINHPIRVARLLAVDAAVSDINVIVSALLHDTVEDTDTSIDEINKYFGPVVARIVGEVSDDKSLPKQARKQMQIDHAPNASVQAKLVKLADKLDNLTDLSQVTPVGWQPERVLEYFSWSEKVIAGLRGTNAVLETRLDQVLAKREAAAVLATTPPN